MIFKNSALTAERFLSEYWQKKPLLLRQALPGFTPELDSNDIAGLACDEMAESRLVTGSFPEHDWQLQYGPFTEEKLRHLPDTCWTLLVQDVEKHYPPLQDLLKHFRFLPRWRLDDLMVSVAAPGGSVGPHADQYDVFLLQAEGRRRWEIAETYDGSLLPDCELNVLREFKAEQEWMLAPGDILYLPPGVAHHGVAQDFGMTWSVGMRAPSRADLHLALGEWLSGQNDEGGRYRDPALKPVSRDGEIDRAALSRFSDLMDAGRDQDTRFTSFIGTFLSRYRLAHEPAPPPLVYGPGELTKALGQGQVLRHNPWSRLLWIASTDDARVFAAGTGYSCSPEFARILCDPDQLVQYHNNGDPAEIDLLCALLNQGHLFLEQL